MLLSRDVGIDYRQRLQSDEHTFSRSACPPHESGGEARRSVCLVPTGASAWVGTTPETRKLSTFVPPARQLRKSSTLTQSQMGTTHRK